MTKKNTQTKTGPDRVKFNGSWEELAARMVKPAPKPEPRTTKKRTRRKAR